MSVNHDTALADLDNDLQSAGLLHGVIALQSGTSSAGCSAPSALFICCMSTLGGCACSSRVCLQHVVPTVHLHADTA